VRERPLAAYFLRKAIAERNYGLANQVWRDASSVDWQRPRSRCAAHEHSLRHDRDQRGGRSIADGRQSCAQRCRGSFCCPISAAVRARRRASRRIRRGRGGSVFDRSTGGSAAQRAARQAEAETLAANIRQRAGQLVAVDQQIAGKIAATVAGIRGTFPPIQTPEPPTPAPSPKPKIRSVDNHTFKRDPAPHDPNADSPWKKLPSPKNAQDVQDVLVQLQRGMDKPNRQLDTPEEMQGFWDWLAKNGRDLPSPGSVTRKALEDGTEISVRPSSESGGPTVEVIFPAAGGNGKCTYPCHPSSMTRLSYHNSTTHRRSLRCPVQGIHCPPHCRRPSRSPPVVERSLTAGIFNQSGAATTCVQLGSARHRGTTGVEPNVAARRAIAVAADRP
jgi:hypothetical protein